MERKGWHEWFVYEARGLSAFSVASKNDQRIIREHRGEHGLV
jgi:hypothetical protein